MFCTQCGNRLAPLDRFCGRCGHPVARPDGEPSALDGGTTSAGGRAPREEHRDVGAHPSPGAHEDWRTTENYRVVLGHPEVKSLIADAARNSKAGMTAETFLDLASPLLSAAGASPQATKLIAEMAPGFYAKFGIKTGKQVVNGYKTPFGRVLAAILCSLASRGQRLVAIEEASDGCAVQADIPSSLTTWKGKLTATLERRPEGTLVSSAAVFEGQASDWGRSKRILDDLHQDILNYRTLQP